jgi:hypothetical protein
MSDRDPGLHADWRARRREMARTGLRRMVVQSEDYRFASAGYANLLFDPDDFRVVLGSNESAVQAVQIHIAEAIGMPIN